MEIATTSVFQAIYPSFVLHKHWEMPDGFNDRLHALAAEDAEANRIREAGMGAMSATRPTTSGICAITS